MSEVTRKDLEANISVGGSVDKVVKVEQVAKVIARGVPPSTVTTKNFTERDWKIIILVFVFSNILSIIPFIFVLDKWINLVGGMIVSGLSIFIGAKAIIKHRVITKSN